MSKDTQIPWTIVDDRGWDTTWPAGVTFAGCTFDPDLCLQVDLNGEIIYAVAGEPGQRMWWFAGVGRVQEPATGFAGILLDSPEIIPA